MRNGERNERHAAHKTDKAVKADQARMETGRIPTDKTLPRLGRVKAPTAATMAAEDRAVAVTVIPKR